MSNTTSNNPSISTHGLLNPNPTLISTKKSERQTIGKRPTNVAHQGSTSVQKARMRLLKAAALYIQTLSFYNNADSDKNNNDINTINDGNINTHDTPTASNTSSVPAINTESTNDSSSDSTNNTNTNTTNTNTSKTTNSTSASFDMKDKKLILSC